MAPQIVTIKETRNNLAELIERVAIGGESFIVTKFGKPKAKIVSVEKPMKKGKKDKEREKILRETFGVWKDRRDIKDSVEWAAQLRKKASSRYGKIFD